MAIPKQVGKDKPKRQMTPMATIVKAVNLKDTDILGKVSADELRDLA
jgi:hypothetical protein